MSKALETIPGLSPAEVHRAVRDPSLARPPCAVRWAIQRDIEFLARCGLPAAQVREHLRSPSDLAFVCEVAGHPVGLSVVTAAPGPVGRRVARYLRYVWVAPGVRGCGVGSRLVARYALHAPEGGFRAADWLTLDENEGLAAWVTGIGFQRVPLYAPEWHFVRPPEGHPEWLARPARAYLPAWPSVAESAFGPLAMGLLEPADKHRYGAVPRRTVTETAILVACGPHTSEGACGPVIADALQDGGFDETALVMRMLRGGGQVAAAAAVRKALAPYRDFYSSGG